MQQIHYTSGKDGVMADRNTNYTYSSSGHANYTLTLEQVCRENLKTVILDNGITNVPDYAFYYCMALEHIEIPATVTAIGNFAFMNCTGLTDLQIPLSVTKFGSSAFQNCVGLKSITFNEAVTSIPDQCFYGCTGLTEIVLHDGIESLGLYAFMNCTGLTSVTLPAHLNWAAWASRTSNSSYEPCWKGCINVQQIHYTSGKDGVMAERNTSYTYLSDGQYNYNLTLEQVCRENLKTVIIDEGITSVAAYAFYNCQALNHILFCGDLPGISGNSFSSVTATAYYPADNTTWEGISDGFGGTLTWVGYTLDESGNRILPDGSVLELPEPVPVQVTSLSVSIPEDSTLSQQEEPEFAAEIIEPIVDQTQEPDPGLMTEPTSPTPPASETASEAETEEPPIAVEPEFVLEPEIEEMPVAETAPDFSLSVTEVIETSGVEMDAYGDIGTHGVFDGEHTTDLGEEFSRHVATFKGLVPGEQYVLLVMVSLDAPDPLSPDNLLYAAQDMADENGNLSFDYVQRYETDYAYVVACGATNQNLKDAVITIPDAFSNEEPRVVSPVVTYNGKVLVEHLDYVLTGDYVYTAAGEYTFGIRGIYNYTGLVECTYTVEDFAIEVQPESYEGFVGDTAVFEVQVNNPDVTYQWYYSKDHGESWLKSSCTDSAYVVEFLSYRNNYLYRCEITDTDGVTLTTDVVSLTAKSVELAIVSHPVDYEGAVNDQVYFTVGATGNGLLYQWYFSNDGGETWAKSGTPGFASATLQPILREYRDGYQYYCQITDVFGSTVRSDVVSMTVKSSEVVITRQPEPVVDACLGQLYYFEAEATGDNLVYRWEYSSDGGVTWQQSWNQGYNTPTLGVRMNANRDGYFYRCKIVSGLKTVIYTDPASLNMQAPSAQILTQPVSVTVVVNKTIQFHVDAAGTDLTYSWYRSNDKGATWIQTYLSGYNTDTLSFVATEARAAMYMCKITDGSGHFIWTSPVKLHVQTAELAILTQPENVTCAAGTTASFCVEAQGDGLKYQWYASSDGGETWTASYLSGYNTANFSFTVNEARASRLYKCIITDSAGNTVETDWVSVILEISAE